MAEEALDFGGFNAGFEFDVSDDERDAPAQAPWDFSDAKHQVERELKEKHATSVDTKIKNALEGGGGGGAGKKNASKKGAAATYSDDDDSDEDDSGDERLAGEEEEETDSDEEEIDDDDDDEDEEGDEDDELDAQMMEAHSDEDEEDEDDEEDEEGDEEGEEGSEGSEEEEEEEKKGKKGKQSKKEKEPMDDGRFTERAVVRGANGKDTTFSASSFTELNLSRQLVKACTTLGYDAPTPIQAAVVPLVGLYKL